MVKSKCSRRTRMQKYAKRCRWLSCAPGLHDILFWEKAAYYISYAAYFHILIHSLVELADVQFASQRITESLVESFGELRCIGKYYLVHWVEVHSIIQCILLAGALNQAGHSRVVLYSFFYITWWTALAGARSEDWAANCAPAIDLNSSVFPAESDHPDDDDDGDINHPDGDDDCDINSLDDDDDCDINQRGR